MKLRVGDYVSLRYVDDGVIYNITGVLPGKTEPYILGSLGFMRWSEDELILVKNPEPFKGELEFEI